MCKVVRDLEVHGRHPRRRPKKTWLKIVQEDLRVWWEYMKIWTTIAVTGSLVPYKTPHNNLIQENFM